MSIFNKNGTTIVDVITEYCKSEGLQAYHGSHGKSTIHGPDGEAFIYDNQKGLVAVYCDGGQAALGIRDGYEIGLEEGKGNKTKKMTVKVGRDGIKPATFYYMNNGKAEVSPNQFPKAKEAAMEQSLLMSEIFNR